MQKCSGNNEIKRNNRKNDRMPRQYSYNYVSLKGGNFDAFIVFSYFLFCFVFC